MKTLILASLVMIAAIAGLWAYANVHADSTGYVYDAEALHGETAPDLDEEDVIIRVNGDPITRTEFEMALASFPENAQAAMLSPSGRKVVAEELIRLELLAQKAEAEGLSSREDVREQIRRSQLEGELVRKNILAQAALRDMLEQSQQAGTLQELYAEIGNEFETADTRQIIVSYAGSRLGRDGVTRSKEEARKMAAEAVAKLRSGADFAEVLAQYGDNPGAGDLGPVRRDSTPPDLAEPIFALAEGETSDPVETPWGFHVFQVTSRSTPTFEELQDQLGAQSQQLWARVAVENLRDGATVELDDEFFGEGTAPRN